MCSLKRYVPASEDEGGGGKNDEEAKTGGEDLRFVINIDTFSLGFIFFLPRYGLEHEAQFLLGLRLESIMLILRAAFSIV